MYNDYEENEEYNIPFHQGAVSCLPKVLSSKKKIDSPTTSTTSTTSTTTTTTSTTTITTTSTNNNNNNNKEDNNSLNDKVIVDLNDNSSPLKLPIIDNAEKEALNNSNNKDNSTNSSTSTSSFIFSSNSTSTLTLDSKSTFNSTSNDLDNKLTTSNDNINNENKIEEYLYKINSEKSKIELNEFLENRVKSSFKDYTPREHQWKTIVSIIKDLVEPQHMKSFKSENRYNYLIQHAAGSGKSLTIASLVYFLYKLEVNNRYKFDTIVIMNDRSQLDAQLGDVVIKFLQSNGITNFCRPKSSKQLQSEISGGKNRIVITTMQKFSQLLPSSSKSNDDDSDKDNDEFSFKSNSVAIISDEAHRSHGKSTTDKLHEFLCGNTRQSNKITYFSFTCTPTPQCLEMFGISSNGDKVPFYTYSMNEALNDNLILDVVKNFSALKIDQNNFNYYQFQQDQQQRYINVDPYGEDIYDFNQYSTTFNPLVLDEYDYEDDSIQDQLQIKTKSQFIIKHLLETKNIHDKQSFKSRAMLVCSGRKSLLVFKKILDQIISQLPENQQFDTIAAFSPFVSEGKSIVESDVTINGKYAHYGSDKNRGVIKALNDDKNFKIRLLIVADKLQTGFDEPSLSIMYIDKKLKGANVVQTLSRLSRIAKDKESTTIIDFTNNEKDIKYIFNLYKHSTSLRDLQDKQTLVSSLNMASRVISTALENEKRGGQITPFCKAILYHEQQGTLSSHPLYQNVENSIDEYLDIYEKLKIKFIDLTNIDNQLSIKHKIVKSIKSTLESLKKEKQQQLLKKSLSTGGKDKIKIRLDYLTDEELKSTLEYSQSNIDYDADFAQSMWAVKSFETEQSYNDNKDEILKKMTKQLEEIKSNKSQNYSTNFFEIPKLSNNNNSSTTINNIINNNSNHLNNSLINNNKNINNNNKNTINNNNNTNNNVNFKKESIWSIANKANQLKRLNPSSNLNNGFQPNVNKKSKS